MVILTGVVIWLRTYMLVSKRGAGIFSSAQLAAANTYNLPLLTQLRGV